MGIPYKSAVNISRDVNTVNEPQFSEFLNH